MGKSGGRQLKAKLMRSQGFVSGFTLIELVVTIAIAALMLTLAIPSFESVINSNRLTAAANETMASLQAARMESIRRNRRTVLCLSPIPDAAAPVCNAAGATGWIVFRDDDRNGSPANADDVVRATSFHQRVRAVASPAFGTQVSFRADGLAYDAAGNPLAASIALCIPTGRPAENIRFVNIGGGSRVSAARGNGNGACPGAIGNNNP